MRIKNRDSGMTLALGTTNYGGVPILMSSYSGRRLIGRGARPCIVVGAQKTSQIDRAIGELDADGGEHALIATRGQRRQLARELHEATHLGAAGMRRIVAAAPQGSPIYGLEIPDDIAADCSSCAEANMTATSREQIEPMPELPFVTARHDGVGPLRKSIGREYTYADIFAFRSGAVMLVGMKTAGDITPGVTAVVDAGKARGTPLRLLVGDALKANISEELRRTLAAEGCRVQATRPEDKNANGAAERAIRRVKEGAVKALRGARLDSSFWYEAMAYAVAAQNRLPRIRRKKEAADGSPAADGGDGDGADGAEKTAPEEVQQRGEYEFGSRKVFSERQLIPFGAPVVYRLKESDRVKTRASKHHLPRGRFAYMMNATPLSHRPEMVRLYDPARSPPFLLVGNVKRYDGSRWPEELEDLRVDPTSIDEYLGPLLPKKKAAPPADEPVEDEVAEHYHTGNGGEELADGRKRMYVDSSIFGVNEASSLWAARVPRGRRAAGQRIYTAYDMIDVERINDPKTREREYAALVARIQERVGGASGEADSDEETRARTCALSAAQKEDVTQTVFTRAEAMASPRRAEWCAAEARSMSRLQDLGAIKFVSGKDLTAKQKRQALGTGWKHYVKANGSLRARGYIQGFTQTFALDFWDSFAPVVGLDAVKLALALTARYGWSTALLDVDDAFQTTKADCEGMIARIWPGWRMFDAEGHEIYVEVVGGINGLIQGATLWWKAAKKTLLAYGMTQSAVDPCFFQKTDATETLTCALTVDDFFLAGSSTKVLKRFEAYFRREHKCKIEYDPKLLLGGELERGAEGITRFTHERLARKFIQLVGYEVETLKAVASPAAATLQLVRADQQDEVLTEHQREEYEAMMPRYASAVGLLSYIAQASRADVQRVTRECQKMLCSPPYAAWVALKRVARYLRGTLRKGVAFRGESYRGETGIEHPLVAFADAAYATDVHAGVPAGAQTGHSWIGGLVTVFGSPVRSFSTAPKVVLSSTRDAELLAAERVCPPVERMRTMLIELGALAADARAMVVSDSMPLLGALVRDGSNFRSRHLRMRYLLLKQEIAEGIVLVCYTASKLMAADGLTKHLGRVAFAEHAPYLLGEARAPVSLP